MSAYTETVSDIRQLIRKEADSNRKTEVLSNLNRLEREYTDMRDTITALRVANASILSPEAVRLMAQEASGLALTGVKVEMAAIKADVNWNTWMLRGVMVATVLQILGGVVVGVILHSMGAK